MIEGTKVMLGETEYTIPPLTLKALRKLAPKLKDLAGLATDGSNILGAEQLEQLGLVSELVHAALLRNYPEMTLDQVEELLDTKNLNRVLGAVLAIAGFEAAIPGEAARP
jgi:hypothetical protein